MNTEMEKIKNEGIRDENADILYGNKNFTLGVEALIGQNFNSAESLLDKALDELCIEGNDHPDILATILKRVAVCHYRLNNTRKLEDVLKELFLIRSSDPSLNVYQLFTSIYNLAIFYSKTNPKACISFIESYQEMLSDQAMLPEQLEAEIQLIRGNVYLNLKEYSKAVEVYSSMCENKSVSFRMRGFALNNRAIARWLAAGWTSDNEVFEGMEKEDLKALIDNMQMTFDAIVADLKASVAAFERLDDIGEDTDTEAKEVDKRMEQLENCELLIEKDLFKSKGKDRDQLTSKKLNDFGLQNIDSIVPLMNMAEVYLLKPGDEVGSFDPGRSSLHHFVSSRAFKAGRTDGGRLSSHSAAPRSQHSSARSRPFLSPA